MISRARIRSEKNSSFPWEKQSQIQSCNVSFIHLKDTRMRNRLLGRDYVTETTPHSPIALYYFLSETNKCLVLPYTDWCCCCCVQCWDRQTDGQTDTWEMPVTVDADATVVTYFAQMLSLGGAGTLFANSQRCVPRHVNHWNEQHDSDNQVWSTQFRWRICHHCRASCNELNSFTRVVFQTYTWARFGL